MRLQAANLTPKAWAVRDSVRPVRIAFGTLRFSCEPAEAVELARMLVAAVDALKVKDDDS
jgi:hypothetical protein